MQVKQMLKSGGSSSTSLLVLALCCVLVGHAHSEGSSPTGSVGLNKFDLTNQYTGRASGGDGSPVYRKVTQAMGRKAIADARDANVAYLRVSAPGFAPSAYHRPGDLDLWVKTPSAYWQLIDNLMDDLEAASMQAVFTFIWNPAQFPAMAGETVHDLLTNPKSRSAQLAERYVQEFVLRYKDRKAILFYELTNELNLGADLDLVGRCRKEQVLPLCEPKGNYTTDEMTGFTRRLAERIRGLDPSRPISSGFTVPRPAAEHLRARPEWITGRADFTLDTPAQLEKNLSDIHAELDMISVHLYPTESNRRFGATDLRGTGLLDVVWQASNKIGKPLFVGEFGDVDSMEGEANSYTVRMLERIAELKVPYSAVWVWQFYQKTPYTTRDNPHTAFSLEPGATDALIDRIRRTNIRPGKPLPHLKQPDQEPPRVVLTWPLACATVRDSQIVFAVASDDSGNVQRVEFWLDDVRLAADATPPYETTLRLGDGKPGEHVLAARAFDAAGNEAEYRSPVLTGKPPAGGACEALMH
jgi:hypothetical protein